MALTLRTDGSSGINLVGSAWWNDYYNVLTGAMNDQLVTLNTNLILKAVANNPPSGMTATATSGSALGIGAYNYVVTFSGTVGETAPSPVVGVVTTSGNQAVNLASIPIGPTGTTARNIYRTPVGGGTGYHKVAVLGNNVSTTYSDTATDASISSNSTTPATNGFGGEFVIVNATNTSAAHAFFSDGNAFMGRLWLNPQPTYGSAYPAISLGIGDDDTGLNWESDGTFAVWNNNAVTARFSPGNLNVVGFIQQSGVGIATGGMRIWTGTSDPGGAAAEGDIWIKA